MVTESVAASVVIVILVPATSVRVSVVESATTLLCQLTANVENRFWSPVFVPEELPEKLLPVITPAPVTLKVVVPAPFNPSNTVSMSAPLPLFTESAPFVASVRISGVILLLYACWRVVVPPQLAAL